MQKLRLSSPKSGATKNRPQAADVDMKIKLIPPRPADSCEPLHQDQGYRIIVFILLRLFQNVNGSISFSYNYYL
jgi:hypothetical protein